jgi:predicted kinase
MKQRLILTIGLPRSGKSTWAMRQNLPVVNPDSVRLAVHGQRYLESAETMVWTIVKYMVKALFIAGHNNVILDATNVRKESRKFWIEFAKQNDLWLVYAYSPTIRDECVRRATLTNDREILPVIDRMADEMEYPTADEYDEYHLMED